MFPQHLASHLTFTLNKRSHPKTLTQIKAHSKTLTQKRAHTKTLTQKLKLTQISATQTQKLWFIGSGVWIASLCAGANPEWFFTHTQNF
jgi:phage-related protein